MDSSVGAKKAEQDEPTLADPRPVSYGKAR
jgi:hypothetical protein